MNLRTVLLLANTHIKLKQPQTAIQDFQRALVVFPGEVCLLEGIARVLAESDNLLSLQVYKEVLQINPTHTEALACLAAHHFYSDQPEVALRFYRHLLQMGVACAELWVNLGLCCFYAGQYDLVLNCFDKVLVVADDTSLADVWYNFGHIAIGIGDTKLAQQCFKISLAADPSHAESCNNLGALELRNNNIPEVDRKQHEARLTDL
eukprot:GHVS01090261.1.p1 GENE.GHVS01090261.1~~GHVS01090261.1.p1  ORF type:complete len:206 (+),score=25.68 GHVS01090261.1:344-961(+)